MSLFRQSPQVTILLFSILSFTAHNGLAQMQAHDSQPHAYNGSYAGEYLNRVAFPIGGIGAGMFCLEGTGAISHVSFRHKMQRFNEPCSFAAVCVKQPGGNVARLLEGPVPGWKIFGQPNTGNGAAGTSYGLPRFRTATFLARFPFATVTLSDPAIPLEVELTGWSPFIPGQADNSSLPVGALEYHFKNPTDTTIEAIFSYNTKNFMTAGSEGNTIKPLKGGFMLWQKGTDEHPEYEGGFAAYVDDERVVVDHCWFRGGWWDALTLAWRNIQEGRLVDNPPQTDSCPGASLYLPLRIEPGDEQTVRLLIAWYVPRTNLRLGQDAEPAVAGPAFANGPAPGTAPRQQTVSGYVGQKLVNTYYPGSDDMIGTLTSPEFTLSRKYIHLLVGGGDHPGKTCVDLLVEGEVKLSAAGRNDEKLDLVTWDVSPWRGSKACLRIVDNQTGPWGHINVDHIIMTDQQLDQAAAAKTAADNDSAVILIADFEGDDFGDWIAEGPAESTPKTCCSQYYAPWYSGRFADLNELTEFWRKNADSLRRDSAIFRDTFYDTTLPGEVIEAVAANLTILKSPTVLRQLDGRLWCFEGCSDNWGCCHGSCTHVWNYAQAIPHLFPDLERTLRETEFNECQDERGHQTFRACLPIRPVAHTFHAAADGQLGGIMKVYREWRISGDNAWMKALWPKVKKSLDYCITTWDPRGRGVLEEPHHNTYDIEYWGPDGHCSSFYLGALAATVEMGQYLDDDVARYQTLLDHGRKYLENQLFNGEYFFQKIQTERLGAEFKPLDASANGSGYEDIIEALNTQGPKYQYGSGCLSDGVLGFWIARVCGIERDLVDREKIRKNLDAIYRYNLKHDLSSHANPQRPSYAMGAEGGLLLCTWPQGGALSIPFVYSDEVWTGIEYQVASHLMLAGMIEQGLDIVRVCRDRYDGRVRNPFNEYECGHWYARAMSSYGLLQGLTGIRYDAVEQTLYFDSRLGDDYRSFLATGTGFGSVGLSGGQPFLDVKMGNIEIKNIVLDGQRSASTKVSGG